MMCVLVREDWREVWQTSPTFNLSIIHHHRQVANMKFILLLLSTSPSLVVVYALNQLATAPVISRHQTITLLGISYHRTASSPCFSQQRMATQLGFAKRGRVISPNRNKQSRQRKKQQSLESLLELETDLRGRGYEFVIGSDDSGGAGCIAGPVVVASCCLLKPFSTFLPIPAVADDESSSEYALPQHEMEVLSKVNDCKELTPEQRLEIYDIVHSHPDIFAITTSQRSPKQIDDINLTRATQEAFAESIESLVEQHNLPFDKVYAIVDGKLSPKLYASQRIQSNEPQSESPQFFSVRPYVNGDANVYTVALSSIIARVKRDELMKEIHKQYPLYGFANHGGYGRKDHIEVLHRLGSLEGVHRMSFKQVKGR